MIPTSLYTQILENMPIPCIDLVIVQGKKILLVYRKQEPAQGQWWLPGGRIFKNETLEQAAKRKAEQEVGLPVEVVKKIGVYEYFSDKSVFPEVRSGTHAVVGCFVVRAGKGKEIKLDETSADYRWITDVDEDLDPYVKRVIEDSEVLR